MTRRALFALAAAAVLDPERLLWRPGAKLVSIPKAMSFQGWGIPGTDPPLCVGDILTFWNDPQQYRVTATGRICAGRVEAGAEFSAYHWSDANEENRA